MTAIAPRGFDLPAAALALAFGMTGAGIAYLLDLPLPFLLGSVLGTGIAALAGVRPFGVTPRLPDVTRTIFVPVIGVSIGASFTPEVFGDFARWWPSFAALFLFVPAAHFVGFAAMTRMGGVDRVTAFYGAAPGGLIEAVLLGEQAGADTALLTMLQFMRLILCIVLIPIGITLYTGMAVGSSSGAVLGGGSDHLGLEGWAILVASGAIGLWGARRLNFPAWIMTGPLAVSAAVHLAGFVEGGPPGWLINLTQLMIGVTLGGRFAGKSPAIFLTALRLSGVVVALVCALAALIGLGLSGIVGESWTAVFLAFAPGGVAEMSLVALSMEISVIYVTAHHVLRIVLSILSARYLAPRVLSAP
jgi:membrane AbrB-like protein